MAGKSRSDREERLARSANQCRGVVRVKSVAPIDSVSGLLCMN
jgi:hypothetical protein